MNLSPQQVQRISDLAKLRLSDTDIAKFQKQLSLILKYVELLNDVDTKDVEPTAQTTGLKNVFREDKPQKEECLTQEEVLGNAPEKQRSCVRTDTALRGVTPLEG